MLPKINFRATLAYQLLQTHFEAIKETRLKDLFQSDPNRFKKFSIESGSFLFDYSKNKIIYCELDYCA